MATYDESHGGYARLMAIDPFRPARTELLGTTSGDASSTDVGKAVKLSGAGVVLCESGDPIYGVIESVNVGTHNGYSVGGVLADSGNQAYATDENGDLAIGDFVVAGTKVAFGTAVASTGQNVIKRDASLSAGPSTVYNSAGLAIKTSSSALAKSANAVYANVGGTLVTKAAGDMPALSGTVTADAFNVFSFFIDAAGTLTTVMGTEGATLAEVVMPRSTSERALVGFVVINPTGTGNFVGGTTALDDGTVVPNAVYVNNVGADTVTPLADLWIVVAKYTTPANGLLIRKL